MSAYDGPVGRVAAGRGRDYRLLRIATVAQHEMAGRCPGLRAGHGVQLQRVAVSDGH